MRDVSKINSYPLICVCFFLVWTGAEENERLNCEALAEKLTSVKDLPRECLAYNAVVNSVLRRSKTSDNAIAFQGMQSGSATSAMAARGKGKESFAQIQRRYTNSRRFSKQEKWINSIVLKSYRYNLSNIFSTRFGYIFLNILTSRWCDCLIQSNSLIRNVSLMHAWVLVLLWTGR